MLSEKVIRKKISEIEGKISMRNDNIEKCEERLKAGGTSIEMELALEEKSTELKLRDRLEEQKDILTWVLG